MGCKPLFVPFLGCCAARHVSEKGLRIDKTLGHEITFPVRVVRGYPLRLIAAYRGPPRLTIKPILRHGFVDHLAGLPFALRFRGPAG